MRIAGLDHVVITTGCLEKCLHFYVDVLGMEHRVQAGGKNQHSLHFGSQKLNIHTYPGQFPPAAKNAAAGCADICLITEDDIRRVKAELEAAGVELATDVVKTAGARGEMESIYMYDPDGNLVEIASNL